MIFPAPGRRAILKNGLETIILLNYDPLEGNVRTSSELGWTLAFKSQGHRFDSSNVLFRIYYREW